MTQPKSKPRVHPDVNSFSFENCGCSNGITAQGGASEEEPPTKESLGYCTLTVRALLPAVTLSLCKNILEKYTEILVHASMVCFISFCTAVWVSFQGTRVLPRLWRALQAGLDCLCKSHFHMCRGCHLVHNSQYLSALCQNMPTIASHPGVFLSVELRLYERGMSLLLLLSDFTPACVREKKS